VDNAWEQEKLEARKMLAAGAAESHTSGARCVGTVLIFITFAKLIENNLRQPIKL
jgi:hypothetical protein